jgi:protein phosphatase
LGLSLDDTVDFEPPTALAGRGWLPRVRVEIGSATHSGMIRATNEDHFLVAKMGKSMRVCATNLPQEPGDTRLADEEGYLMVVADGLGGAAAGEEAAALAVGTVEEFALNTVKWFLHLGRQEETALMAELRESLERGDREVLDRAARHPDLAGMGTTLTVGISVGTDLFVVHAGDSRAYLLRDGELTQLTSDHTLVQLLVAGGALTPEQAKTHRRRNVVTNVIGGPTAGVLAEVQKVALADGDVLLLCTDGLTDPVSEEKIVEVLSDFGDPDDAAARLVGRALRAGGPDNITAVVARYRLSPDSPTAGSSDPRIPAAAAARVRLEG